MDKQHYVGMALNLGRDFLGFPSHMAHSILQLCTLYVVPGPRRTQPFLRESKAYPLLQNWLSNLRLLRNELLKAA